MHDDTMNPKDWNPDPDAIPPSPPENIDEEFEDVDATLDGDEMDDAPDGVEEDAAETVVAGPSTLSRFQALAASGGSACRRLARGVGRQAAKLPAALRKRKSDDPFANALSTDEPDPSDLEGANEAVGDGLDGDDSQGDLEVQAVPGGFLASRRSRIQAAAFVSTGLLTTALVVHNVMKPGKPDTSPDATAPSNTPELAKAEPEPAPAPTMEAAPEPEPEPEPPVVAAAVEPPPETIAAAPPPEAITAEPASVAALPEPVTEAAPPEPVTAMTTDPLAPDLTATTDGPAPAMPPLPPPEVAAAPDAGPSDLSPPALVPEEPAAIATAPADSPAPAPEPVAAVVPPESTEAPPALAAEPDPESAPEPTAPEPPTAMASAPAMAIPNLAPPPEPTPEPAPEPTPAPATSVASVSEPEPAPASVVSPVEPPPAPATPDLSELKPLPNAGRRILTMGSPIGDPQPLNTIAVSTAAAATPVATAVPISAESFQVEHVVQRGENFFTISKLYYGSGRFYKALWKANARTVKAPDALVVGHTIVVPPPESLDRTLIDPPGGNLASSGRSTVRDPATRRTVRGSDGSISLPIGRSTRLSEDIASLEPEAPRPSHVVRDGETLRSIARDRLGNSRRESEIRQLNLDVISDDQPVVGQRLRLPSDATATQRR